MDIPAPPAAYFQNQEHGGSIEKGMNIKDAIKIGGSYTYVIKRDREKWPEGSDPRRIIFEQIRNPDNSVIKFIFKNTSQFGSPLPARFYVVIEKGIVTSISRMD